jgi:hypothetical protein
LPWRRFRPERSLPRSKDHAEYSASTSPDEETEECNCRIAPI